MTPLTKSGKYNVAAQTEKVEGNRIDLKASDDLLGYEEDFYDVKSAETGVHIRFKSATAHMVDGKTETRRQPTLPFLQIPEGNCYARLLYLTRESLADYDGAILAASSVPALDALTQRVEDDPAKGCVSGDQSTCHWIPLGISVQPDKNRRRK